MAPGHPMHDDEIASQIGVSIPLWRKTKEKMRLHGELEIDRKVGIRYAGWKSTDPLDKYRKRFPEETSAMLGLSEQELQEDRDKRVAVADRFNALTGLSFDPDLIGFVRRFRDRTSEGATPEQFDIAMRRSLWAHMNGPPMAHMYISPYKIIGATSFWRWVHKEGAPAPTERIESTRELIMKLEQPLKRRARELCSKYYHSNKTQMRSRGWNDYADIDYSKVMTCKEYIKLILGIES
jgi:hypothetical protein